MGCLFEFMMLVWKNRIKAVVKEVEFDKKMQQILFCSIGMHKHCRNKSLTWDCMLLHEKQL